MKTTVEFRSSKFPAYEGEEEEINPGLWGRRLAEYLVQGLAQRGIQVEKIIGEDWGYYLPIPNEGFKLALCCGHQYGDGDVFVCFTHPKAPVVKRFFKTIDASAQLARVTEAVQQILSSDPEISDIVWSE